jgi:hypothetical protein
MRCVPAHHFTVAKARTWRSAIEENPPYQRESAVWALDKQQLFIDSLLNGYDVPKIYLHDLRGAQPTPVYAIVDGKQRLTTIWDYLDGAFPLAAEFRIEPGHLPDLPPEAVAPVGALRFSELDQHWQRILTGTFLSVVLIRDASEEDIEDLFSRLNNGEALNSAERRNAMGGDMVRLIRDIARRPFFSECLSFPDTRQQHRELASRILAIETTPTAIGQDSDLEDRDLDELVRGRRDMTDTDRAALTDAVSARLDVLVRIFSPADARLASPAQALLYYRFVRWAVDRQPSASEMARVRTFLGVEASRLIASGATAPGGMERGLGLLRTAFATTELEAG